MDIMNNNEINNKNYDTLKEKIKILPENPGVYLMKDKHFNIIYVGKAVNLKNRVSQYFQKNQKSLKTMKMVENIHDFEIIITNTEDEALIQENILIKQYRPKYNILLKDDKTYPHILIDTNSKYPILSYVRRIGYNKKNQKVFGPYASSNAVKKVIEILNDKYKLRQCKFESTKEGVFNKKPCIYSQLGKCDGICTGNVSKENYEKRVNNVIKILKGKNEELIKLLEEEMKQKSANFEYEKAAEIRDVILSLKRVTTTQTVSNFSYNTIDAIGIASNNEKSLFIVFEVRNGSNKNKVKEYIEHKNIEIDTFNNEISKEEIEKILIEKFLLQYYIEKDFIPNKIMIPYNIKQKEKLEEILTRISNHNVEILVPKKGENYKFVDLAISNAKIELDTNSKLAELNESIQIKNELENLILENNNLTSFERIEGYDISNTNGEDIVASMIVVKNGKFSKKDYRKFMVKTVVGQNDYASIEEIIKRRFKHTIMKGNGLGEFPQLIIIDGGIGQIKSVKSALNDLIVSNELNQYINNEVIRTINEIKVVGLVKNNKHQTKGLINEKREEYEISQKLKVFLTKFQDQMHEAAIEYHKKKRDSKLITSELDSIPGIGDKKKILLLNEFKSVENIKKQSIESLIKVKGINQELAKNILKYLNINEK